MITAALQPLTREAGEAPPDGADFARLSFLPLQCTDDLSHDSFRECGTHTVHFTLFGIPICTELTVQDTTPPVLRLQDAAVLGGSTVTAEDFLLGVQDATAYTVQLTLPPSADKAGTHSVTLTVTDACGNKTEGTASLTVYGSSDLFTVEAGTSAAEMLRIIRREIPRAEMGDDFSEEILSVLGESTVSIHTDSYTFPIRLQVKDTIPPVVETKDVISLRGYLPSAMEFIDQMEDVTEVTGTYITPPDTEATGWQKLELLFTDAAGNRTDAVSYLRIYDIPVSVILEAGTAQYIAVDEILAHEPDCSFAESYFFPDMPVGVHPITVCTPDGDLDVELKIVDMTPPKADPLQVVIYLPSATIPTPADFVENVRDVSEVTASFMEEVDFATPGRRLVPILLTDASGNTTTLTAYLTVVNDHTAPIITGVKNLSTYVNGRISYKTGVTATDSDGSDAELSVDSSAVNLSVPGRYRIIYTATDSAGNTATAAAFVTVEEITEDVIRPYAENILDKILKSGMTAREKARAIYDWMTANIAYVTYADKTYWMRAAYYGFSNGRGDCYVYYAMSRILLDCAGIENMEICRDNPAKPHYWNLVNCGDGWYHFDTCPHYKQYPLTAFMLTDAEVEAYSKNKVKDYYSFDKSLYPATP